MMDRTGQMHRAVRRRVVLVCGALVLVAALAAAAAGATRSPGLDRSYGKGGVVRVRAPLPIRKGSSFAVNSFGAAGDGAAYAVGTVYPCTPPHCGENESLIHFGANGALDRSFGGKGFVSVHGRDDDPTAFVDGAARAIVLERDKDVVTLRRFEPDGEPDRGFGRGGIVKVASPWKEGGATLLEMSGGRLMIVLDREERNKKLGYGSVATKVRLVDLLPDGARDKGFGESGIVDFRIPRQGGIGAVARTADDAIIFGGIGADEPPRRAWFWRITASGQVDSRFDRNAAHSFRRLGSLGEFSRFEAIVPRADGTIAAVGTNHEYQSFVLRVRRNGKLATGFGRRGLVRLPAIVDGAVGGIDGAVFMVGERRHSYYYAAYRVLRNGRLDPAYHGGRGIAVPLPGEGISVESQGGGRALVTNLGYYECREGCPAEPGMARYRE